MHVCRSASLHEQQRDVRSHRTGLATAIQNDVTQQCDTLLQAHSLSLLTSTHNNINPFAPQHHQLSYSLAECSVNNVPLPFISHLGTFYQLCSFRRKKIKNIQETYLRRTVQLIKGYKHMYTLKHNAHPKISGTSKSQM